MLKWGTAILVDWFFGVKGAGWVPEVLGRVWTRVQRGAEGQWLACQVRLTDRPRRVHPAGKIVRARAGPLACHRNQEKQGVRNLLTFTSRLACRAWAVRSSRCAAATSQPTDPAGSSDEQACQRPLQPSLTAL